MNENRTIFKHRVEITDGKGIIRSSPGFSVTKLDVIAENNIELVVSEGSRFTVIQKKKSQYQTSLDEESICLNANDSVWGNRITYSLYSERKRRASTIRAHIEAEIQRRFGFFLNGIDLSCITDKG